MTLNLKELAEGYRAAADALDREGTYGTASLRLRHLAKLIDPDPSGSRNPVDHWDHSGSRRCCAGETRPTSSATHMCSKGCEACAEHDPRDRPDHGHLTREMCPTCAMEAGR